LSTPAGGDYLEWVYRKSSGRKLKRQEKKFRFRKVRKSSGKDVIRMAIKKTPSLGSRHTRIGMGVIQGFVLCLEGTGQGLYYALALAFATSW